MVDYVKEKFNNIEKPNKFEIGFLIFILVACFFLFNQEDLLATSTHGKDLLQVTLKGKFLNFYDYTEGTAVYLIPIYIFFAIWSIPVMIIYGIRGVSLWGKLDYSGMSYIDLMWYKLLPVIFCILTCFVIHKIVKTVYVSDERKKWINYLYFSFPILIFSQFIFGQYDSFNMFFTTLAVYYYLNKKYYKSSLIMSIAITFKLFPLFIFVPLILLVEKRIIHIFKYVAIALSGTVISNLLFVGSKAFAEAKEFNADMFDRLFRTGIHTSYGQISLFLVILIGVCSYCYMFKLDDSKDSDKKINYISLYTCLAVYSSFYAFVLWHPQWVLLLVPFWILMMLMSDNIKMSFILSIFLGISYLVMVLVSYPGNVDEIMVNRGLLPQLFGKKLIDVGHFQQMIENIDYLRRDVFTTIFVAALSINLVIKYPTKDRLNKYVKKENKDMPEKGYILALASLTLIFVIPAIYFFAVA